jgi:hypothetical protein
MKIASLMEFLLEVEPGKEMVAMAVATPLEEKS